MNSVTQGLLDAGHHVKVLSVCSDKHPVRTDAMDEVYMVKTGFEAVHIDLAIHPLPAAVALLCGESYNVKRFVSKEFDDRLKQILKHDTFDIIHVESIFLASYLPTMRRLSNARIVLRAHNVENLIWRQMAVAAKQPLKRWYLKKLALALRMYELEQVNLFDGIACITARDAELFRNEGCRKPVTDIPFGVDIPPLPQGNPEPMTLFHIGAMDWQPNIDSIKWLLEKVWPLLHQALPQARLFLAGRKMPDELMRLHLENVSVVGEVDDARQFMASKQINLVPLLAGSGIRIKILEALSLGKTVVSTSVGANGINYTDGHDLLIANTPEEFVRQVKRCAESPELCHDLGSNGRKLVEEQYCSRVITDKLVGFYNKSSN